MSMLEQMRSWRGRKVIDRDGKKIGELIEVLVDDRDESAWGSVRTAEHDGRLTVVPLDGASPRGCELRLACSRRRVLDAPSFDADAALTADQEREVFAHFGRAYDLRRVA